MQLSEAEADDTLYSLAGECEELFAQTHEKLKHDASGQDPAFLRLFDEYQHRFIAWTAYLGVFANKNVCLDRRLRRHPEVQDLIVRLLDVVHLSLQQLSGFATEHADQPLIDDDGEPRVGAAAAAAGDLTLDAINDALDRLNHIGITIRQSSAMRNSNTIFSRDSSESESFRQIMLICIQSLYPAASPAIQEHLMEYLASRHNEIIGKQSRQKKYGTRRPKEPSSSTQNNAALVTKEQQQPGPSPFATQSHLNGKGTLRRTVRFDLGAGIVQRTEPSTIVASLKELSSPLRPSSRKTGASSVQVSPRRYPDPPQPGENSIRTCKWCFQSLGDKFCEGTRWKLHVDKDFNPYVCLWEHCTRPKRGFSTFSAWSEHMSVEHGESWYTEAFPSAGWACIICPRGHNEFDSPKELTDHLSASHGFTSIQCEAVVDQSRTFIQRDPKHCVVCCRKVEPDPAIGDVLGKRVHDSLAFRGNQKRVRTDDGSLEVSTGPDSVISGPQPLGQPGPNTTPEPTDREKMSRHIAGHLQTLMFVLIRLMDTAEGENEPSIGDAQTSSSRALSVDSESLSREAFDEDGSPLIFSHPDTEIGQMDLDGEAPPLDQSSLEYLNRSNVLDSDSQVEYWRNHSDIANTASAQSLEKMQEYLSSQLFRRGHSPSFDVGDRCSTGFPQKRKMETHQTDPVLKTKVEKKYGQVDFERFDDVASSHMRAGYAKIGKVEIDCKFNFRKSRW
ncbi:hypothetical protein B0T25DRAFT_445275 [Lasiosphaeria hispida]|uniref:C2H2-type domain-containing protein n=1 Tax=Lasiosphaeria hispida TaxID=260671 RepID=A0AAJ0MKL6_9PEZI|nr:hypothetical protein B0T25DRAFT_445275 [Lasiosphaeria hispida]